MKMSGPKSVVLEGLREHMERELREQEDPRISGAAPSSRGTSLRREATSNFYERFMRGEKMKAGWVNPSDFEADPIT